MNEFIPRLGFSDRGGRQQREPLRKTQEPILSVQMQRRRAACVLLLLASLLLALASHPRAAGAARGMFRQSTGQVGILTIARTAAPSQSGLGYNGPTNGLTPWVTNEPDNEAVAGGDSPWAFSNWHIRLTTAPGLGSSYTFTLRVNEADTPLVVP